MKYLLVGLLLLSACGQAVEVRWVEAEVSPSDSFCSVDISHDASPVDASADVSEVDSSVDVTKVD